MGRLLIALFVCLLVVCHTDACAKETNKETAKADLAEIQAGIMSFADTWTSGLRQASVVAKESLDDQALRLDLDRIVYYAMLNGYDIAAGPYPGVSMLDMMVMATLTRGTAERHMELKFGPAVSPMIATLGMLEEEIWRFSESYLDDGQRQALAELAQEWLDEHPRARSASFIRLSDFGELGRKPTLEAAVKKGGFLSPIRDAAESAAEIKALAERGLYLSIRMQELMMGRAELLAQEFLSTGEMSQLLDDISGFRTSSERYARVAEDLPLEMERLMNTTLTRVSAEREAALGQALEGLSLERSAALAQVLEGVAAERQQTLDQALEGLRNERKEILKSVAQVIYWGELEVRASLVRVFILAACLMALWFGLRLTYRYWIDRVANNFVKTFGLALLLMALTLPIMLLGHFLVGLVSPDFTKQTDFLQRMDAYIDEMHSESVARGD